METTIELRKQDIKKLEETLKKKENELMEKKIMYTVGKSKDISIFGKTRKEIARIKTVLREKEILNG